MPNHRENPTKPNEIEELRARLAEAEQTLQAIRSGEVDAVVVEGPNGPQVYTLQTPDQPYRVLVERMNEGTASVSEQGIILFCNQKLADMVGQPAAKLLGSHVSALVLGAERKTFDELLARSLQEDVRAEIKLQRRDGAAIPVQASMRLIEAEHLRSICLVATDVSALRQAEKERDRAEAELRKLNEELEARVAARTQELHAINQELEAFNYAIAHDLRSPLRHIQGYATLLEEEAGPALVDSCQRYLASICNATSHMSHLLEDLLSLSRLGRQEVRKQICGLNSLFAEAVKDLKLEAEGRQIEWRIGRLPWVDCDPALMKQVVSNLLSNAVKFTAGCEPAIIELGQTMIDGEEVTFVRDNGVGFNMKYADKLFGLFQRLHRQEDFKGTGVGLAIVQRILQKHGGRVWAEAELNKGATFYFTLPKCERAETAEEPLAHVAV